MVIMKSEGWCCEKCGGLIKGKCRNINGRVTHIGQCSSYVKRKKKK